MTLLLDTAEKPKAALAALADGRWDRRHLLAALLLLWLATGIYIVPADQQAVVTRFGAVVEKRVLPGIHLSLPWPVDRVTKLKEVSLTRVRSRGYSFFEEILWHLRHVHARFTEVPITFRDRERGQSKINVREAITAISIIASLTFKTP